jgi:DNA-binding helix-hairpin-helix protein with protein kinase domain
MSTALFDSKGAPIVLGHELGMGGEGTVYELPGRPKHVAKLYNPQHRPDEAKEAKLTFMAESADEQLLEHVAWPESLLRQGRGGPIVGFLMPKLAGYQPIHATYSPARRRQERPKLAWDFLVHVARNLAAAFDTIHAHGHVVGDVNQGNILVADDSQVVLIDSDSFQIDANGTLHLCDVGVAHFVPPELQGQTSFIGVRRTQNQDNFGLAALIFHLLFGGRHPFSGVPLAQGVGQVLENDIKAFRYAYSRDHEKRGIAPPPRSIPINLVPERIEAMFQLAFTERGAIGGRPSAKEWVGALDELIPKLTRCPIAANHVFPQHLQRCPWCSLESQGVVYFLDLTGFTRAQTGFVLSKVWELIEAVPPPTPLKIPRPEDYPVVPVPAEAQRKHKRTIGSVRFFAAAATLAVVMTNPELWIPASVVGVGGAAAAGLIGKEEREAERARRKNALDQAEKAYQDVVAAMQSEAGIAGFRAKKVELQRLRQEYLALPRREKSELDQLHVTARERQLKRHLENQFIDTASIGGIGPQRKSNLRSFGIETAADVKKDEIAKIPGIGPHYTTALLNWRTECEQRFRFDGRKSISETDRNIVKAACAARKLALEATFRGGIEELQKLRERAAIRMAELQPRAVQAAKVLSQARSNYLQVM